jgi:molecular chaperone Hsp33
VIGTVGNGDARRGPHEARDLTQPFRIEGQPVRGRLVRLGPLVDTVISRHDYPEPVAELLAELLALAAALSAGIKYDGVFTLQTKGDGPVRLMVADVTSGGDVRGYAQFDAGRVAALKTESRSVPHLLGSGYLAFTVDQGPRSERYQGLVELIGATLVDCVHHYFRQSEQIPTGIKLAVGREPGPEGTWRAGVLMLQRLPPELSAAEADEATEEGWRRSLSFMASATAEELLDPGLAPNDLLYRLAGLRAGCRCSRERVSEVLRSLPRAEIEELTVDGEIVVTCEFCNSRYRFDEAELDALFAS